VLNCGENAAVVFTIATAVSSDRTVLVNMFEPSKLSNSAVEDLVWQKTKKHKKGNPGRPLRKDRL
jgi:hypothetical protein